ncbi:UDP-2,4-diacetamido-2,4,6-trideoxy-beta-L-altropyranose hydrolase [Hydrogenophaga sp.]|uniref:UDP-2,4-diacetamido-2,4, 6-trideoxy-beta-L-altropyranose hydrolase n=1 Tax=Hydrogenophaga sp. TaxID=1904254 RepID=UPI0025B82800|nr:UDP-2,4-diacetamido-2,4,6-trideoxy-beta-L-altropyranose hydrolase [Hydrogenophaga sp.]
MAARVSIRVDASARMGTGHLKRCLALADALEAAGAEVGLVVRAIDPVAAQLLARTAWAVKWLSTPAGQAASWPSSAEDPPHAYWAQVPWQQDAIETIKALRAQPPDWLVLDHYAFDARWHQAVTHALGVRLLVIDDTADRSLAADALLDHNWHANHRAKYAGRLLKLPRWLCGPRFALLSSAYRDARRYQPQADVRSIGIFMGGTDPGGISMRVLAACRDAGFTGEIEIATTSANPKLADLRAACAASPPAHLTIDLPDLASFFARHDLQIGAGGGATWERCCIGAPTIALALTNNQTAVVPALAQLGAVRAASLPGSAMSDDPPLTTVLVDLLDDAPARARLAKRAGALVDGRGAQRVALHLLAATLQVRPAIHNDAEQLLQWRNNSKVRAMSIQGDEIALSDHLDWLSRALTSPDRWLMVGHLGEYPVGSVRFDRMANDQQKVSLYLDPDLLGLGLGPHLLLAGEQALAKRLGRHFTVRATVLPGNTASQRLFETCGYHGGPLQYAKSVEPSHEDS